ASIRAPQCRAANEALAARVLRSAMRRAIALATVPAHRSALSRHACREGIAEARARSSWVARIKRECGERKAAMLAALSKRKRSAGQTKLEGPRRALRSQQPRSEP